MQQPVVARGNATRQANKEKRRENILSVAREIISNQGFDAFTLALLAEKANVTIPTIHNLIGKKSDVFQELVGEMVVRIEEVLAQSESNDPIIAAEAFIDKLLQLFAADEAFYKAAFVAGERTKLFEQTEATGIFSKSLAISKQICVDAKDNGFLLGRIDSDNLAHHLFASQRLARQDWVNGYIDLDAYRNRVLVGMCITWAADATPEFHQRLMEKIDSLETVS